MSKKLSLSALKQMDAKNYSEKKKITINDYDIVLNMKFRDTVIEDMLQEMLKKQLELEVELNKDKKDDNKEIKINVFSLLDFYIIKFFTNIGESMSGATLLEDTKIFNMLLDNGFANPILEVFTTECLDELKKLFIKMADFTKRLDTVSKEFEKSAQAELEKQKSEKGLGDDVEIEDNNMGSIEELNDKANIKVNTEIVSE